MTISVSRSRYFVAAAIVAAFLSASPAWAQCEPPGTATASGAAASGTITGLIQAQLNAGIQAFIVMTMQTMLHMPTQNSLNDMNNGVINRMKKFWGDWDDAWRNMSAQLSAGKIDSTRQLASIADVSNSQNPATTYQEIEYKSKVDNQPSVEGCGFDTTARYNNAAMKRSKGLSSALANDLKKIGVNNKGTPAANGPPGVQKNKWAEYIALFCDPSANNGHAGCNTAGAMMNADIQPSKTILSRDTIDMSQNDLRRAVNAVTYNVIGYKVPSKIQPSELNGRTGKEKRNRNREYLTQMDAVSALVTNQIAERAPGEAAPEVKAKRIANGIHACASGSAASGSCASDKPSEWEVRQSVIEEIRSPKYYVNLSDSSNTTAQKEVMLQAYNVMMMYKILEKSAMISNAFAIQTANLLERTDGSRSSARGFTDVQEPPAAGGAP